MPKSYICWIKLGKEKEIRRFLTENGFKHPIEVRDGKKVIYVSRDEHDVYKKIPLIPAEFLEKVTSQFGQEHSSLRSGTYQHQGAKMKVEITIYVPHDIPDDGYGAHDPSDSQCRTDIYIEGPTIEAVDEIYKQALEGKITPQS